MLFGLLLVVVGIWRLVTGTEDGLAALATGGIILGGGFFLIFWTTGAGEVLRSEAEAESSPESPATDAPSDAHRDDDAAAASQSVWFSVIESVEDKVIDRVAALLADDPRITHIAHEQGRHYSTPDGDDLPEWFALRCQCAAGVRDAVMADAMEAIARRLGPDARDRISIGYS